MLVSAMNGQFSRGSRRSDKTRSSRVDRRGGGDVMERRDFLKFAFGVAAGAAVFAARAQAAPLMPQPLNESDRSPPDREAVHPAVTTGDEVDRVAPEQVRWGHGH